jgi:hypothetical protein
VQPWPSWRAGWQLPAGASALARMHFISPLFAHSVLKKQDAPITRAGPQVPAL